jgi:hypothetical protein
MSRCLQTSTGDHSYNRLSSFLLVLVLHILLRDRVYWGFICNNNDILSKLHLRDSICPFLNLFNPKESWHLLNMNSFKGFGDYFVIGIPSALMLCLAWWSFEALIIMSGWIDVNSKATAVILFNILTISFVVPNGFSIVSCTNIGNSLGEGNTFRAK